jgi:hypothetical protein
MRIAGHFRPAILFNSTEVETRLKGNAMSKPTKLNGHKPRLADRELSEAGVIHRKNGNSSREPQMNGHRIGRGCTYFGQWMRARFDRIGYTSILHFQQAVICYEDCCRELRDLFNLHDLPNFSMEIMEHLAAGLCTTVRSLRNWRRHDPIRLKVRTPWKKRHMLHIMPDTLRDLTEHELHLVLRYAGALHADRTWPRLHRSAAAAA